MTPCTPVPQVQALDREVLDSITLLVAASDNQFPPKVTLVSVFITVTDKNDQEPTFLGAPYTFNVRETQACGTEGTTECVPVGVLAATDADEGLNAHVTFAIVEENTPGYLRLNATSGHLSLTRNACFFDTPVLVATVQAVNGGIVPNRVNTTVTVTVLPVNNFAPVVPRATLAVAVDESDDAAVALVQVEASDPDCQAVHYLVYTLLSWRETFAINASTGWLTTTMPLDFEVKKFYSVLVDVTDEGIVNAPTAAAYVPRSTKVQVECKLVVNVP